LAARTRKQQFIQAYYEAFPNNTHSIEDIIAKNDKIILRQINIATHDKEFDSRIMGSRGFSEFLVAARHGAKAGASFFHRRLNNGN